jgi:hypothetical protein
MTSSSRWTQWDVRNYFLQIQDRNVFAGIFSLLSSVVYALENRGQETEKESNCVFFYAVGGSIFV